MTIDEEIKHQEEISDRYARMSEYEGNGGNEGIAKDCAQCAADHAQLAEWLTELKELKAAAIQPMEKSKWCPPLMGQGKCDTYCERCHGKIMRNSTGIFEETPFCPHCGAEMKQ